ncbi:ArsC/Spx/MgsR family protein [Bergeyella sp. RCAD1439]|uniref:ArsC/Spx/MgsR family protein n=1 Tax=Bergeyella anatis TaxID=3113737 RepID=UPI002E181B1C|nr:ArsC/Spx/MgsR family protein [Bergeyella sp. RCAD1439]
MMTLLHNNRCSKSREAVKYLEDRGVVFNVRYYLEDPLSEAELRELLGWLGLSADKVLRKNEPEWKDHFSGKVLSEEDKIKALLQYPKLLQRPILIKREKAVVARPAEAMEGLL